MTPDSTLRAQLLAVALRCPPLSECDPSEPLRVTLRRGGAKVTLTIRPEDVLGAAAGHTDLTPMEQAILTVATSIPQTAKRLAGLAHKTMGSHVNKALATLVRRGLLLRKPEGYCLPE